MCVSFLMLYLSLASKASLAVTLTFQFSWPWPVSTIRCSPTIRAEFVLGFPERVKLGLVKCLRVVLYLGALAKCPLSRLPLTSSEICQRRLLSRAKCFGLFGLCIMDRHAFLPQIKRVPLFMHCQTCIVYNECLTYSASTLISTNYLIEVSGILALGTSL